MQFRARWVTLLWMRILLSNDDGVRAAGLAALAEVAGHFGEVFVVAPTEERSGFSHALTLWNPLRLRELKSNWWACDGTPADCVYLAVNQLKLEPDVVISGINPGPNLGHDVIYSGTVAAAMEGSHWGIPSIALSHLNHDPKTIEALAHQHLREVLERLIPLARTRPQTLNVNFPDVTKGPFAGMKVTKLGSRYYSSEIHERRDPRGRRYYWIGGAAVTMADIDGSDCNAVKDGHISVTPLGEDLTAHHALQELKSDLDAGLDSK